MDEDFKIVPLIQFLPFFSVKTIYLLKGDSFEIIKKEMMLPKYKLN